MIRVNLLPQARERRGASPAEGSQTWLLAILALVLLEIVALFFFHQTKEDELADVTKQVQGIDRQISEINDLVKDHKKVKERLQDLRDREETVKKLMGARNGPTGVLLELSRVLTRGKGPTVDDKKLEELRRSNPLAVYSTSWDPKRLWLTHFAEEDRLVRLEGLARDGGDVYEFAQRLKVSQFFEEVTLLPGKQETSKTELDLVKFALRVKVKY